MAGGSEQRLTSSYGWPETRAAGSWESSSGCGQERSRGSSRSKRSGRSSRECWPARTVKT